MQVDVVGATLFAAVIGAAGGIIGNLIGTNRGATLSREAARQQHEMERQERDQAQKERMKSVRTMVSLEIDQNLAALRDFWSRNVAPLPQGTPDEQQFLQRRGLTDKLLPPWNHLRWESLPTELGMAFTPSELKDVQHFHSQLEALSARRALLIEKTPQELNRDYDEFREVNPVTKISIANTDYFGPIERYLRDTGMLWWECEDLFRQMDFRGNPLAPRASGE